MPGGLMLLDIRIVDARIVHFLARMALLLARVRSRR